jgi:[lysine-biosynthesis-protein LysW]---L-2-aminoadipate ligase
MAHPSTALSVSPLPPQPRTGRPKLPVRRLAIVAHNGNETNRGLLGAASMLGLDSFIIPPGKAARRLHALDLALGRLDVLPTVDGPEPGLEELRRLESKGVHVLNRAGALLCAHDKLATALRLSAFGLPHPRTAHIAAGCDFAFSFPVVVKPRFGSWGRDVTLCPTRVALERCLRDLRRKAWFRRQGALVQEFVQPRGRDLRILVAATQIVGAVERIAAQGEWRTNISLGGRRRACTAPPQACQLAREAAAAVGTDLAGVDLLPNGQGGWVILEVNGAVEFSPDYSVDGKSVFGRAVKALAENAPVLARSTAEAS